MAFKLRDIQDKTNADILNAIRHDASADYRERIPVADQSAMTDYVSNLFTNTPLRNEFVNALINRIGTVIARSNVWENPLAEFKSGRIEFGDTVEEYYTGLLKAHTYSAKDEPGEVDIFGQELPEVAAIFHKVNRQDYYKVTVNDLILRRAFLDENGLANFISDLMASATTSDQIDEFLLMTQLFPEYERAGGFYHAHIDDVVNSAGRDPANAALRRMRSDAALLTFPSEKYNAAHMPAFINRDELILITTPQFQAAIDVESLAAAFNIDRAEFSARTVIVPPERMGITGAQAILTGRDFFRVWDTALENRSMVNPVGLYTNYFLHHHQIISTGLFVPAIMYTTGSESPSEKIVLSRPTAVSVELRDPSGKVVTAVSPGGEYSVVSTVTTDPVGGNIGTVLELTGQNVNGTMLSHGGVLQVSDVETAKSLKVSAVANQIDPDNPSSAWPAANASASIEGAARWPVVGVLAGLSVQGVDVSPAFAENVHDYTVTVPSALKPADVRATVFGAGTVSVSVADAKATVVFDAGVGVDPVTYTITATVAGKTPGK